MLMLLDQAEMSQQEIEKSMSKIQQAITELGRNSVDFAINLVISLVLLLVGWWLIRLLCKLFVKGMTKAKADPSVISFLHSIINLSLKILLIILVIGTMGFDVSSIVAALGAAAVTVGLALKDSLSNVASGTIIILFKKFKTGDFIETEGITGEVIHIDMMYTTLRTYDYREVLIPNSRLTSNNVINHFSLEYRRLEIPVPISYKEDFDRAKSVIMDAIEECPYTVKEKKSRVFVDKFGSSSVDLWVWVWVRSDDYWDGLFDMRARIKAAFDKENITIPFNQLDIHMDVNDPMSKFESVMEDRKEEESK